MATATQRAEDVDVIQGADEVSLSQKMLSAVSGSILTSLLGKSMLCMLSIHCAAFASCVQHGVRRCLLWTLTDIEQSRLSTSSASAYNHKKHQQKRRHIHRVASMAPHSHNSATFRQISAYQHAAGKCSG
jgi:hypothetical protein